MTGNGRRSNLNRRRSNLFAVAITAFLMVGLSMNSANSAYAAPGPADAPEWWFDAWQVPAQWSLGADGRGITVAVIDTGVQASLAEFSGKILPGVDYIGNGSDGRIDYDSDLFSHGTAMASLIVADGSSTTFGIKGLAPGAKILPIAIPLQGVVRTGSASPTPDSTSLAVRYAADHGAKVISMSLGGQRTEGVDALPCPQSLQSAIVYALSKGALVVSASGNSGAKGSPVEEPGVCLGAVSVGSVDPSGQVSTFSSRHPYLTVSAPGSVIPSLGRRPGTAYVGSGTSQATAITSAALAMIWSKFPTESNWQILTRLLSSASDIPPAGKDSQSGVGLINPAAAIAIATVSATAPNIVHDAVRPLLDLASNPYASPDVVNPAGDQAASVGALRASSLASSADSSFIVPAIASVGLAIMGGWLLVAGWRRHVAP